MRTLEQEQAHQEALDEMREEARLDDLEFERQIETGEIVLALMQDKMKAASTLYGRDLGFNDLEEEDPREQSEIISDDAIPF